MDLMTQRLKLKDIFPKKAAEFAEQMGVEEDAVEYVRKGLTAEDVRFEEGEQAVVTTITTDGLDRDGEIVDPKGVDLKDYLGNPVVMFGHNYSDLPIGKNLWVKMDGNKLVAKTEYAPTPFAQEVFEYRKAGFPLAQSIGFVPLEWTDHDEKSETFKETGAHRTYNKVSLLEYSDVPIPSNPEALAIAVAKGLVPASGNQEAFDPDDPQYDITQKELDEAFGSEEPMSEEMKEKWRKLIDNVNAYLTDDESEPSEPEPKEEPFLTLREAVDAVIHLKDPEMITLPEIEPPVDKVIDPEFIAKTVSDKVEKHIEGLHSSIEETIATGFARLRGKA